MMKAARSAPKKKGMGLRTKTLLLICLLFLVQLVVLSLIVQNSLIAELDEHEVNMIELDTKRVLSAFENHMTVLNLTCQDWAAWDDTYEFVYDLNEEYIESNLVPNTFDTIGINTLLYFNDSGELVYGMSYDLDTCEEMENPEGLIEYLKEHPTLLHQDEKCQGIERVASSSEGSMVIVVCPIMTSEEEGPVRGTLVMGYYLGDNEWDYISNTVHLPITAYEVDDPEMPSDFTEANAIFDDDDVVVTPLNEDVIAGYMLISDTEDGTPLWILKIEEPRTVHNEGIQASNEIIIVLLVVIAGFAIVSLLLLNKMILSRIARLSRNITRIGASGNLSARVRVEGSDELTHLQISINTMLGDLQNAQRKLIETEAKKRRAEEFLAMKDKFIMDLSHELKTPLSVIINNLSLLREMAPKGKESKWTNLLDMLERNAGRLGNSITNILEFTKLGRLRIADQKIDLKEIITDIHAGYLPLATAKGLKFKLDAEKIESRGDRELLRIAIGNVIGNAIKFTNKGSVMIKLKKSGNSAVISVTDTGAGISPENQKKLFTRFFKTDENAPGMGVGLNIAKEILSKHNGKITVTSKIGKGSTFTIVLPLKVKK